MCISTLARAVALAAVRAFYGDHGFPCEVFSAFSLAAGVALFLCRAVFSSVPMSAFPSFGHRIVFRESYVSTDCVFSACLIMRFFFACFYFW